MKHFIRCEVIADGSIQDSAEFSRAEVRRLSEALGQAVPNFDGNDRLPFLKLMRKVDKLLERLENEIKEK